MNFVYTYFLVITPSSSYIFWHNEESIMEIFTPFKWSGYVPSCELIHIFYAKLIHTY